MKKEKTIRTYQRKTKSGKVVTVRAHKAKYDAAEEKAKELAKKKKGSGNEILDLKNKNSLDISAEEIKDYIDSFTDDEIKEMEVYNKDGKQVASTRRNFSTMVKRDAKDYPRDLKKDMKKRATSKPSSDKSSLGFTPQEFKEWYKGTGSAADKKVAKELRAKLGRAGYNRFEDEAIDFYTPRGYTKLMKKLGGEEHPFKETKPTKSSKASTASSPKEGPIKRATPSESKEGSKLTSVSQLKEGSVVKFSEGGSTATISKIHPSGRVTVVGDDGKKQVFGSLQQAFNNWKATGKLMDSSTKVSKPKAELSAVKGLFKKGSEYSAGYGNVTDQYLSDKIFARVQKAGYNLVEIRSKTNADYTQNKIHRFENSNGESVYVTQMHYGPGFDKHGRELPYNTSGNVDIVRGNYGKKWWDDFSEKPKSDVAKKLPKGSFHTVDSNGKEIPDAPKHGGVSKVKRVDIKKNGKWLSPEEVLKNMFKK